jgi:predicted transcriptional regulator
MSIHPRYAGLILSGRKRVEFRRTRFRASVSHVLIYETAPVQRVTGFFEVAAVIEAAPQAIWQRFAPVAGIDHAAFSSYFAGRRIATAIEVGRVVSLSQHVSLTSFEPKPVVPQSFRYVAPTWLERVTRPGVARWGHRRV